MSNPKKDLYNNLVYCCKSSYFYNAVSCWFGERTDDDSLFLLPAFKDFFTSSVSSYFFPGTSILSFDTNRFNTQLRDWAVINIAENPGRVKRINKVVSMMKYLINDETWAVRNQLIIHD